MADKEPRGRPIQPRRGPVSLDPVSPEPGPSAAFPTVVGAPEVDADSERLGVPLRLRQRRSMAGVLAGSGVVLFGGLALLVAVLPAPAVEPPPAPEPTARTWSVPDRLWEPDGPRIEVVAAPRPVPPGPGDVFIETDGEKIGGWTLRCEGREARSATLPTTATRIVIRDVPPASCLVSFVSRGLPEARVTAGSDIVCNRDSGTMLCGPR